ncbi:MAG: phosphatase, partial [Thermocrispum sp.]
VDPDAVLAALPEDASAGRPHLARVLVDAGVVATVSEAFEKYLGDGSRYYLPRADTPVEHAIGMIAAAGGVTVLAHPWAYSRGPTVSADVIADLAARGLSGLEVEHPNHEPSTRQELRGLAAELDLLTTGSSDYHGSNKDTRLGAETTDPQVYERLIALATGGTPVRG